MNISSIIVQTYPEKSSSLQDALANLPGVEIHGVGENGMIVITVEDTLEQNPANTLMNVQNLQGVLSASMVYNYCDE